MLHDLLLQDVEDQEPFKSTKVSQRSPVCCWYVTLLPSEIKRPLGVRCASEYDLAAVPLFSHPRLPTAGTNSSANDVQAWLL
jgi:hypothetical protein